MFKFIKNKFLFIVLISIMTLVLLIAGSVALYKDSSLVFSNEGYIISSTTKKNAKYYFSANTKYKENVDEKIAFKDSDSKSVSVDPASFVHYLNGSIGYLKKGALVNLSEINSSAINYYNITNKDLVTYKNGFYSLDSNKGAINVESFVGRISDNKYIIAGKNLALQVPDKSDKITGDYFEVLFIENGIVKIDNQEASYQVTAQDTSLFIGDNIIINLGNQKIYYNGDAKMLLSQITINGDENIDLATDKDSVSKGGGSGDGNGTGGSGGNIGSTDGTGEGVGNGSSDETGNDVGSGSPNGTNDGDNNGETGASEGGNNGTGGGNGNISSSTTNTAQIELIEANVTSTTLDLSLQLNNASAIKGTLVAYLTNVSSGKKEYAKNIEATNGTFKINKESLSPDTEYTLTIIETGLSNDKQYFQKTFKTNSLGLVLEKEYATDDTLSYNIIFDENTEVTKVRLSIYDNSGTNNDISPNEYFISADDISSSVKFTGLSSNTSYSVMIDTVWINNAAYSDVYTINRIDTTLKKIPTLSNITVEPNPEEIKFTIKLNNVVDIDTSILSYTYYIYLADDITADNENPTPIYSVTKNDLDPLILNLNEIDILKTGVDYRCRIVAQYDDNEMIREVSSEYSENFLIKSKPNVSWTLEKTTMNTIIGKLTLIDANCSVPVNGRSCLNESNKFTLRYYKLGEDETSDNDIFISFSNYDLSSSITLSGLSSNTTYAVKVYGNYYDDLNILHKNVQIGDVFYVKTDESEDLKLKIIGDNKSGTNKDGTPNSANVVTFDAMLQAPKDSTLSEEVSSITLNLYSGSYNVKDKLIGTYVINDRGIIQDFFSNYTITNSLFTNETEGKIDSLKKLIRLTNNQSGTLNGSYTVEITKVLDSTGTNEIRVEDNIYTFKLTPSYYLDSRIETNPDYKYINVSLIEKKDLTEDEYVLLSKTVKNIDLLNDDTIVGLTIENSLSDAFVDSAFIYEKVVVDYVIYNSTTKKEIKRISVDMGNKYQPKSQTIYLDSSELDDGKNYFTRGYNYKVSYELNFKTENGDNPTYVNDKLSKNVSIERQSPIYTQYISKSTYNSVTYRYSINDIDNDLYDNNLYYSTKDDDTKDSVVDAIIVDGEMHDVTIPLEQSCDYSIYLNRKNTSGSNSYTEISKYNFESEYNYNNEVSYSIVNDNDNTLKIKLENNDITDRTAAYKVTIKTDDNSLSDYVRYFLASKLSVESVDTGLLDEEGNAITEDYKYITIDYANINEYMGHNLTILISSYFDSGLVGFNQDFTNGLILKNNNNKYLNIYNSGSDTVTTNREDTELNGIYMQKEPYEMDSDKMFLYNYLQNTLNYNPLMGTSYYSGKDLAGNIGINYSLSYTNNGIVFNDGKRDYSSYNAKLLKIADLKSNNNKYKFNSIVPKVSINTSGSTINSVKIKINSTGVYGQFIKDGKEHNKFYIDVYSNSDLSEDSHLTTLTSDITIDGQTAEAGVVEYKDLTPSTTYYVTVSAYLDGKLTRLYDIDSKNSYVVKTYEAKTLDANGILEKITFSVNPVSYNNESSNKNLIWRLKLKDVNNYKIRFELYDKEGNAVNFDGSSSTSCDNTKNGSESNSYVSNCYIQIDKDDLSKINNVNNSYIFSGDSFVFGGEYYKLIVYAVPYTNSRYAEEDKLILYQNDSLSTTGDKTVNGEPNYNITIPVLEEASFDLKNTLISGTRCVTVKDGDGNSLRNDKGEVICDTKAGNDKVEYYIEFTPTIVDNSYVIKYGTYTIKLKNAANEVVETKTSVSASLVNKNITFVNLDANTLYYVELSYETYRNNNGYTESQKIATTPFTDFIYTPINAGITLGTMTAGQISNKNIVLSYNGASNLVNNIVRVQYTVSLKGGSSKASGSYTLEDGNSIFTISSDKVPKLTLDLSNSSDPSFTLKSGNTYIISTQYWYLENGEEVILEDQNTHNSTFTTILNL